MVTKNTEVSREEFERVKRELKEVKEMISEKNDAGEEELTDWAKEELEEARNRKNKVSHEEVKNLA